MYQFPGLVIDLYQNRKIADAERRASDAALDTKFLKGEILDLQWKADALTIACQALWEVLRGEVGLSDDMILMKMEEIDLRDGRADGKISREVVICERCGRKGNSARKQCLYCGSPLSPENVFESY
ncbi:MAG: hypothetical protein HUU16_06810 [Candidatus Omnitrophica bacterium]|nr:hypothetical protein [Candidatus Omnitrophota bacterium]